MLSVFRRRNDAEPTPESEDASDPSTVSKAHSPTKGRPTPKRKEAGRGARRPTDPPPRNRREAFRRQRDREKAASPRAAKSVPDLAPRDQGPERALVRNLVDSRHNIGSWFFLAALVILFGTSKAMPVAVQLGSQILWYVIAAAFVVDIFLIIRRVHRTVKERFPKSTEPKRSLYLYAVMRSIVFRRLRAPKPAVKVGEKI